MPVFKPELVLSSPFQRANTGHFRPKDAPHAKATSPNRCRVCTIQIREPKKNSRQTAKPPRFTLRCSLTSKRGHLSEVPWLSFFAPLRDTSSVFLGRSRFLSRQNENCSASILPRKIHPPCAPSAPPVFNIVKTPTPQPFEPNPFAICDLRYRIPKRINCENSLSSSHSSLPPIKSANAAPLKSRKSRNPVNPV